MFAASNRAIAWCRSRVLVAYVFALATTTLSAQSTIDVQSEIWPILRERCIHCHGADQADGQLRLDRKSWIQQGGHTGNAILGTVDESELLRRLTSHDPNYRMPKDGSPLPEEQVAAFATWIQQGAPWPDDQALFADSTDPEDSTSPTQQILRRALEIREGLKMLAVPSLVILCVLLALERRKKSLAGKNLDELGPLDRIAARLSFAHYCSAVLLIVIAGLWLFHRGEVMRLQAEKQELASVLARFEISDGRGHVKKNRYAQPDHTGHPSRLGGTYYRGNDERNPKLFNGGYYRTATMELSLRNNKSQKLERGEQVDPGSLVVHLEIERAPFATRELFRDESMKHCRLTRDLGGTATREFTDDAVKFNIEQSGEKWSASYPIAEISQHESTSLSGTIYVCNVYEYTYGYSQYGIRYDIDLKDNVISDASELWMGATMYSGKYVRPPADVITPNQWFSFLPIPEIEGGNTSDPILLGIPEHEKP